MFPKQHAAVSGILVAIYAIVEGLSSTDILFWAFLGGISGVLIDVDHALLSIFIKKRYSKGLKWFRNPVKAISRPSEFLADMDYENLIYHRIISHTAVLGIVSYFSIFYSFLFPVTLGVGVHLICDLGYDLYRNSYWFQS